MKHTIYTATSISKDKSFDPFDTLIFSQKHHISGVQIYLDKALSESTSKLNQICEYAFKHTIKLSCHVAYPLSQSIFNSQYLDAIKILLAKQIKKQIIIHFDEHLSLHDSIIAIKQCLKEGLLPCIENYYQSYEFTQFLHSFNAYNMLIIMCMNNKLEISPVFDIPRLFIQDIKKLTDPILLTQISCNIFLQCKLPTILHMIDYKNDSQERETWCAIGKGAMPYKDIFSFIAIQNLTIDHIVLEFESKKKTLESIEFLNTLEQLKK